MLKAALVELILERGLEAISIRDLTERADIGYATFYRHCKSKEELLQQIFLETIADLRSHLQVQPTHYEEALALYEYITEKRDIFVVACRLPRDHPVIVSVWSQVRELVVSHTMARMEIESPLDVSINHLMNSVWEMIRWWIEEGEHYSPEQMATFQSELIIKLTEEPILKGENPTQSST